MFQPSEQASAMDRSQILAELRKRFSMCTSVHPDRMIEIFNTAHDVGGEIHKEIDTALKLNNSEEVHRLFGSITDTMCERFWPRFTPLTSEEGFVAGFVLSEKTAQLFDVVKAHLTRMILQNITD